MRVFSMLALGLLSGMMMGGCQFAPALDPEIPQEDGEESGRLFITSVKPVLEHRCLHCHHEGQPNGGLNFQDRGAVLRGNAAGPFLVSGKPEESRIWQAIDQPASHPHVMPGDGWGLTDGQRDAFERWIETGAHWPTDRSGRLKRKNYEVEIDDYL